ncbi:diaminopimelate decarboxylase [Terrilactibacillus laevilacticus]|uniref:diaminopimelate decarboxylase n=1 Tax=Terrilactibacillus laevilacticus TaxID=1380157 RepID=UPI001FE42868|nr:diaminopimelate decarboxylase [Terrilactibacillus laevilacticus]
MRGIQHVNKKGHLTIGGVDTVDLVKQYGSPLYVYDVQHIRNQAKAFQSAFSKYPSLTWHVAYASKAFSSIAMVQLANELGLSLDVVSGGELFTAIKAGFPAKNIQFHGNNKTIDELDYALNVNIGTIIIDNFYEIECLEYLCKERQKPVNILLRITPGVEAHTHDYIMTGQEDSKFGFSLVNGAAEEAVKQVMNSAYLQLRGLHCHIGSQIFDTEGFKLAIKNIYNYLSEWKKELDFSCEVLNVGGGFGIKYNNDDQPLPISTYIDAIVTTAMAESDAHQMPIPEIWVEPGRVIVGEAGTTLYKLGSYKTIPGIRKYVSVDGGMADNLRPALYQAKYEAILANKANAKDTEVVTIAGKCCESGDILIHDAKIPKSESGDILAVLCTGAYGYSMANHYNRLPKPAVVFVENGESKLVIQRETYEDLVRFDCSYSQEPTH